MKIARILTTVLVAFGAAVLSPSAAFAHDEVTATSPSNKATVSAGAFDVSVTFNEDVLNVNGGHGIVIQVFAPGMKYVSKDCVRISGKTIATRIDVDKPGKYAVAWQSVSSDGHTNTGVFSFTVVNNNGYKAAPVHVCENANPGPTSTQSPTNTNAPAWQLQNTIQVILFILVVIGGAGLFVRRYLRGRNQKGSN